MSEHLKLIYRGHFMYFAMEENVQKAILEGDDLAIAEWWYMEALID